MNVSLRKILITVMTIATIVVVMPQTVSAAPKKTPIGFVQNGAGISWMYTDGSVLKNDWITADGKKWHFDANGMMQIGLVQVGKNVYLLNPDGTFAVNWTAIGDGIFYFNPDGTMVKNKVVDGYQLGPDGNVVFTAEQLAAAAAAKAAQNATAASQPEASAPNSSAPNAALIPYVSNIIAACTTADMLPEQKLLACYNYFINYASYKRTYETPAGDWTGPFAYEILSTGQGNCFRYAAAFAYIAKALGYEARVCTGQVKASRGGTTPHGWTEVFIDGGWYVFDTELADAKPGYKAQMFKTTYSAYPLKPLLRQAEWPVYY